MKTLLPILSFVAVCALGCAGKRASTTTVQGTLTAGSFGSAPVAVVAVDEQGTRRRAPLAQGGAFRLVLPSGHRYALAVVLASGSQPIVFQRSSARLDTSFHVSGAATVTLGNVRSVSTAPSAANGAAQVSCGDGEGDGDGDFGGEGNCENGKDPSTGGACAAAAGPEVSPDPSKPMAIPDHQVPAEIGCDGESED